MKVALLVPCFIDQLFPDVALATMEVLKRQGIDVRFPESQICCGQVALNIGGTEEARDLAMRTAKTFDDFEYVVAPSASCVATIRTQYPALLPNDPEISRLSEHTYELCEFLVDVVGMTRARGSFRHRVGIHIGCHGLRALGLASTSERPHDGPNKVRLLLESLDGVEIVETERADECCGFGGVFSYGEEAVSAAMGRDRVDAHETAGVDVIASTDASCLMHLDGLIRREGHRLRTMHVAQILAGRAVKE